MPTRPYEVILDANIWVTERLLHSSLGAALLYSLRETNSLILLPEVVEEEVIAVVTREGNKAVGDIESGFVTIQAITVHNPAQAEHRIRSCRTVNPAMSNTQSGACRTPCGNPANVP